MTQHKTGKYYVGRHSTNSIDDGYFGSGKWVRSIKDKMELSRKILNFYSSYEELLKAETELLNEHIGKDGNMNFNNSPVGFASGELNYNCRESSKAESRIRLLKNNPMKGKTHTQETKLKMSDKLSGKNNPMFGKTHSDEFKIMISKKNSGRIMPPEEKIKRKLIQIELYKKHGLAEGMGRTGAILTDDTKRKISERALKRQKKICPHCLRSISINAYAKWHDNNCKILKDI